MYSPVSAERARELLKRWFKEQGLIIRELGRDYIILQEGDNDVLVKLFFPSELVDPEELSRVITELARIRDKYNKVYLAVPQNIADMINGTLLKKAEVGLLVVNIENDLVIEQVRSPPVSIRRTYLEQMDLNTITSVVKKIVEDALMSMREEIRLLKERIVRLEQQAALSGSASLSHELQRELERIWEVIDRIKVDLARLSDKVSLIESQIHRSAQPSASIKPTTKPEVEVREEVKASERELPEFLRDNPWIAILRQRAKET